ncbi:phage tail protein [Streptococcus suis]|uniref:phage tail protein n=1 Tax=Streptococcus suis TaxID=1307 RepID=UPI0014782E7E|nr:phage tail protein [Streptococcus suis]MBL6503196.1 phage tail protein [Streptococcus suis]MBM0241164.1 phage tail protein [Streptococcus suis]MBM7153928.1 phage tail protein [Streptococcus suis]MBM7281346.1 phage tail protein [Streptococcus suis]MBO4134848.1 phage tail protein [Streptococcus suis]
MSKVFDVLQDFEQFEITNGQFRPLVSGQLGAAERLGCTGSISVEAESKTVTKKCEGNVTKEVTIIQKLNATVSMHMPVAILRKVFGLTNDKLKTGVYGLTSKPKVSSGALTWDMYDLGRENHKLIAFPNISWTSPFKINVTNGEEEIAEIETTFSAFADENGFFYYEAIEGDGATSDVVSGWNKTFTPTLVKKAEL